MFHRQEKQLLLSSLFEKKKKKKKKKNVHNAVRRFSCFDIIIHTSSVRYMYLK